MRAVALVFLLVGCGQTREVEPAPEARLAALAAPCLAGQPALAVAVVVGDDHMPAVVNVTGTRDAKARACVARAVKSVAFPDRAPGQRFDLALGPGPSAGE